MDSMKQIEKSVRLCCKNQYTRNAVSREKRGFVCIGFGSHPKNCAIFRGVRQNQYTRNAVSREKRGFVSINFCNTHEHFYKCDSACMSCGTCTLTENTCSKVGRLSMEHIQSRCGIRDCTRCSWCVGCATYKPSIHTPAAAWYHDRLSEHANLQVFNRF